MSRPGTVKLSVAFAIKGLGKPGTTTLDLEFEVSPPEPSIMMWDGGDWRAVAQRVWAGDAWFPPTE